MNKKAQALNIIMFFVGIFLIYTSYLQICLLTETLTGNSIEQVGESIQNIFNELLEEYRSEDQENICFRKKIMLLIGIISGQIREQLYNSINTLITNFLNNSMNSVTTQSLQQCTTNVYSNSNFLGRTGNLIASATSAISGDYTQCINTMTLRNMERIINIEYQNLQDLLALFRTQSSSIINFLRLGTGIVIGSSSYLIYRGRYLMYNVYVRFMLNERRHQVNIRSQLISRFMDNNDVDELEILLSGNHQENNEEDDFPGVPSGGFKSKRRKSNMKNKKYTRKHKNKKHTKKYKNKKHTKKNIKIKKHTKKNIKIKKHTKK